MGFVNAILIAALAAAAAAAAVAAPANLAIGICRNADVADRIRHTAYAIPAVDMSVVVTRAVHGAGAELLRDCDAVFAVMLGHEAFLLTNDVVANLPHAVSKASIVHPIAGTPYAVLDVAPSAIEAFAAVAGDRERLRPLAPRTKRATSPVIRAHAKEQQRATKDEVIASLDDAEFETVMRRLSGAEPAPVGGSSVTFTTRYTLSAQNTQAAQYIYEYFVGLGYADVFYHEFRYSSTTTRNIIAVKRGTVYPDEVVVYGAHMDSTSGSANTLAPGCIDNGSGTGSVMVTARAFANVSTERTIYFMLFSAEEQGLIGSEVFVEEYYESGDLNIVSALTMDMIGYSERYNGVLIEGTNDPAIVELMDGMEANTQEYAPELTIEKAYFSYGSDHVSFQRAGIPAFLSIEQDNTDYPGYHSTQDTVAYLSVVQSMGITRGMAGLLWDVAGGQQ